MVKESELFRFIQILIVLVRKEIHIYLSMRKIILEKNYLQKKGLESLPPTSDKLLQHEKTAFHQALRILLE